MINDTQEIIDKTPGVNALLITAGLILSASCSNPRSTEDVLNQAFFNLAEWTEANMIEVSPDETTFQIFNLPTKAIAYKRQYLSLIMKFSIAPAGSGKITRNRS